MSDEKMIVPKGQMLKVNGLEMYYEEVGEGEPLILIHGGTATASSWQGHLPEFAKHFRVIMPESRGHGSTNNPGGVLTYALMAEDFAAFVEALGLSKPFIFGYSDGGQTALEIGMRYPALAGALVIGGATYEFSPQYYEMLNTFSFITDGKVDTDAVERDEPEWAAELQRDHAVPGDPDKWKTLLAQITPLWLTQIEYELEDLRKITAPTMILVGDRDEGVPVEQAVAMYRTIPAAALVVLPDADHGSAGWVESGPNPLFTESVIAFLLRHGSDEE